MNSSSPFDPSDFFGEEWKFQKPEPHPKFQPGDKVACFYPILDASGNFTEVPLPGRLYVVRECGPDYLTLVGIIGKFNMETLREHDFKPDRFVSLEDFRRMARLNHRLDAAFKETKAFWKKAATPDRPHRPKKSK